MAVLEEYLLDFLCGKHTAFRRDAYCHGLVDVKGVKFYGFRVCTAFREYASAGEAAFTLSPRQLIDVDGNPCKPDKGFKLICKMLRRKPDSELIWYRTSGLRTPCRKATGRRCPAHGRFGRKRNIPWNGCIYSLRGAGSLHGSTAALRNCTCGQGWRSRQTAVGKPGYSAVMFSAV